MLSNFMLFNKMLLTIIRVISFSLTLFYFFLFFLFTLFYLFLFYYFFLLVCQRQTNLPLITFGPGSAPHPGWCTRPASRRKRPAPTRPRDLQQQATSKHQIHYYISNFLWISTTFLIFLWIKSLKKSTTMITQKIKTFIFRRKYYLYLQLYYLL